MFDLSRAPKNTQLPKKQSGYPPILNLSAVDDKAIINMSGIIIEGEEAYEGYLSAGNVVKLLNSVASKDIHINLTSPGGSVVAGVQLYEAVKSHPSTITVNCVGIVASAATYMVLAADKTTMNSLSQIMIHQASGMCWGTTDEMTECASWLLDVDNILAKAYSEKMGIEPADAMNLMKKTTFYNQEQAIAAKLIDAATEYEPKASNEAPIGAINTLPEESLPPIGADEKDDVGALQLMLNQKKRRVSTR